MRIYKYRLEVADRQTIWMPKGAKILTVQDQGEAGLLSLWAQVDETIGEVEDRVIAIYGTGNIMPVAQEEIGEYIATAQTHNGMLVWHVFEVKQ